MKIFINIPLTLCTLLFINFGSFVNATRRPWTTAENRGTSGNVTRRARAVNKPTPVDCIMGRWSSWTPCNSCTDKKFRFRYLERPSQFGGTECTETLWEKQQCPNATAQCLVPDYCGKSFTCHETGRCISQLLRCNGEADCEDNSDEDGCDSIIERSDKCSTMMPIPGAERATQGYNVLTGEFVDHVVDPKYFGGTCEYVYNGEWRKFGYDAFCENLHYNEDEKNYRKPYNFHTYRFVAEATSEGSHEYYDDMMSMLKARKTMDSFNLGVTVGVYYIEGGISGGDESEFLRNITKRNSQDYGFIRLWSKVQTARFKMRTDKLMLHEDFYVSLMELPEQYDFGMYSRFFNTFGTHYVTGGTMGGTLEYVVVVNKTLMARSKKEGELTGLCLGASIGLGIPLSSYANSNLRVGVNKCTKHGSYNEESPSSSAVVEDIVTLVRGGVVDSSSGLLAIRNPETYKNWGATLKYNPTLIESETMPIYELVRFSTATDHVGARLANLQRATDEYLQQFDSCRCVHCRNNGIPVLQGTTCKCNCNAGYRGDACEETLRSDTVTDGAWSCWGTWSSCVSGRKTRTRTCTNPAPSGGGTPCLGSSSQSQRC